VAPSYIPQGLALVEGRVFDGLTVAETIVGTTLVPELIADEPVVIRVAPRSHRIVVGKGQGRVGGAEASREPLPIHLIEVGGMSSPLIVGTEAVEGEDHDIAVGSRGEAGEGGLTRLTRPTGDKGSCG